MQSMTSSCLELFDDVPVLNPVIGSNVQEILPSTSLDENSIEFNYVTDGNIMLDLRDTHFLLKVKLDPNAKTVRVKNEDNEVEEDELHIFPTNNFMHSLFSNCEVYFNNYQIYNSNGLYPHKALISNEFNATHPEYAGILQCHGYDYEANPADFNSLHFKMRKDKFDKDTWTMYGKLCIDAFTCEKLLLPKTKIRIKLIRSRANFHLITPGFVNNNAVKISHASLFTRRVEVHSDMQKHNEMKLSKQPARYHFNEWEARTYIIPDGQNVFKAENIFNNAPIRRLVVAMNTNAAFTGTFSENPYNYRKFGLQHIRVVRGNQNVVDMNTEDNTQVYVTTMKAMKLNEETPTLPFTDYDNHFIMVFDLTSLQDAGDQIYYPEVIGGSLRLELYFDKALEKATEIIVEGERLSTIHIDRTGTVAKNS